MNKKPHCLVTCRIHPEVVKYLEQYCTLDLNQTDESLRPEELRTRIKEADAVMMFMPALFPAGKMGHFLSKGSQAERLRTGAGGRLADIGLMMLFHADSPLLRPT